MRLSSRSWARVMLGGMILALWPVWRWYALRMVDGSDEPCGLLALGTFVCLAVRDRAVLVRDERQFVGAALLIGVYVLTYASLSPLPRAMIAISAIAFALSRRETLVAGGALLLLSLPVIATAQFYVGYPLRVIAAEATVLSLRGLGYGVTRTGSMLAWRGESILVDAPCSGVRMLWFGLYLAAAVAAWSRFGNVRSALLISGALLLVIAANALRASILFFKEAGIVALPHWTHAAIGLLIFAAAAALIARCGQRKEAQTCCA